MDSTEKMHEAEMGALLASTVKAVLDAQRQMDESARAEAERWVQTPLGEIGLPPIWYTFRNVVIELEMSAAVAAASATAREEPQLVCRLLNPQSVGLFGYQASAGMKVRLSLGPQGMASIQSESGVLPQGE